MYFNICLRVFPVCDTLEKREWSLNMVYIIDITYDMANLTVLAAKEIELRGALVAC